MNGEIRNPQGERLDYAFHVAGDEADRILIIGHGVTGTKDRPWAEALANAVSATGIPALRFSFAGNGDSEGTFADCTISKEVADLGAVIDAAAAAGFSEITFAGHSMGGAVGVLRASSDSRISRLISLAGMVHTKRFTVEEFGEETPDSGLMWEDEDCPLSSAYVNDLTAIDSVIGKAAAIKIPWLLVHGDEDDVVPIGESREIFEQASEPKKLVELPGVNHVFADAGCEPMVNAVTSWISGGRQN
ncbi:MAG: alpha/beta superfamily hydrolase [Verrucomicrobiales bacterium]|jgi:alpha/beta superfamily hydrolase